MWTLRKCRMVIILILLVSTTEAQDLESIVDEETAEQKEDFRITETYKSDRIINSISNEMIGKRELDFKIDHHFGDIAGNYGGYQNFYGLDQAADIRIGFTYGVTDRINIGIGRLKGVGQQRGLIETTWKYAVLQQSEQKNAISITYYGTFVIATNTRVPSPNSIANYENFIERTSFFSQVLFSRKMSSRLSLSAGLAYVYLEKVASYEYQNHLSSVLGFRYKIAKRWGLIGDWYYHLTDRSKSNSYITRNPLSIGAEIETGGHVFHICFMNNRPLSETQFIPRTQSHWADGEFRWGFKISRIFNL